MKSRFKKSGFTLAELLVVVGIFTLIIGVSFTLLSSGRLSVDINEARIQAQENARIAMERITRELRLSGSNHVRISDSLNFTALQQTGTVINFQIPVGSYAGQLVLDKGDIRWGCATNVGHYIAYSRNAGNRLLRSTYIDQTGYGQTGYGIVPHISGISFSQDSVNPDLIHIEIAGIGGRQTGYGQTAIIHTLRSSIKLRN